jgi:hypothetical protein
MPGQLSGYFGMFQNAQSRNSPIGENPTNVVTLPGRLRQQFSFTLLTPSEANQALSTRAARQRHDGGADSIKSKLIITRHVYYRYRQRSFLELFSKISLASKSGLDIAVQSEK